jgi:hypothetical protein
MCLYTRLHSFYYSTIDCFPHGAAAATAAIAARSPSSRASSNGQPNRRAFPQMVRASIRARAAPGGVALVAARRRARARPQTRFSFSGRRCCSCSRVASGARGGMNNPVVERQASEQAPRCGGRRPFGRCGRGAAPSSPPPWGHQLGGSPQRRVAAGFGTIVQGVWFYD